MESSTQSNTSDVVPQARAGDFVRLVTGRPVVIKLVNDVEYRGVLACLDGFLNVALEQTEEYVNGKLRTQIGDAFIRGNNVLYIAPADN